MYKTCLTNDDGPHSRGLLALAESLAEVCELTVIVPDGQRSATGKGLTLNRPLRATETTAKGYRMIMHDGTPADSVVLAPFFMEQIDLFVSGINAGANLGYQSILTSGTVGAAMEASLKGYKAIAASMEAGPQDWFNQTGAGGNLGRAARITCDVAIRVLKHGLPDGTDILNLNFPCHLEEEAPLVVTRPTRVRMRNEVDQRTDPHGRKYYWFVGVEVEPEPGTDAHVVLKENGVSISPLRINGIAEEHLEAVRRFLATPFS
ncbi:MAG: 5'/3'-nucleotidase SurE [Candidatus Thorarchaeota archaeon]|nr:5'/3'-nucleotidase SurE [Candidatus Thorarchaeota archaeon]